MDKWWNFHLSGKNNVAKNRGYCKILCGFNFNERLRQERAYSAIFVSISLQTYELQKFCKKSGSHCKKFLAPILITFGVSKWSYSENLRGLSKKSIFWRLFPLLSPWKYMWYHSTSPVEWIFHRYFTMQGIRKLNKKLWQ